MKNIKKILFVSHDVNRAGAQLFILSIMKYFKQKDIEIVLLAINDWGALNDEFSELFPVYFLNNRSTQKKKLFFGKEQNVIEEIKRNHFIDLIYLNTIASVDLLPELTKTFEVPIVSHIHELQYSIAQYGSPNSLEILFKYSTKIIACSQAVSDNLNEFSNSNDIHVVHSFVENTEILNKSANSDVKSIKEKYGLSSDKIWICACGNADWRKAPDIFLQIAAATMKNNTKFGFVWIGIKKEGELFDQLKYDEKKFGIENEIRWISPTSEAVEIINCCDVFLVSSREDPFPLVVLEAALCGKPILGFRNTGGADEFIDDSCGIKVDYLNVSEMSKQITTLNSQNIKNLGEKSRDKVLTKYNFEVSIKKIESIFEEMV
ncbi:glycosyltransferase family 4 protein [Lacihabitans sp. CS3-21]|uniref:glycosyltransferase family 4 protein n=1 Tax=Lacihabitans sp. CS3-21 TaxID=2487332 RepID=UPI0020CB9CBF|nr:glycosyltransferase family 4 protein [Lacihabitans sp. CS3-21]MCP9745939.1 glycosyltransferase family 1 protein [Lacihabitans sp. CS3-21]